eukprot:5695326-Prymnesium_polylepis.2
MFTTGARVTDASARSTAPVRSHSPMRRYRTALPQPTSPPLEVTSSLDSLTVDAPGASDACDEADKDVGGWPSWSEKEQPKTIATPDADDFELACATPAREDCADDVEQDVPSLSSLDEDALIEVLRHCAESSLYALYATCQQLKAFSSDRMRFVLTVALVSPSIHLSAVAAA